MFPGLQNHDFGADSLYRILREEYDVWPWRSEMTIGTLSPDAATREILGIEDSVHCLMKVDGLIYDSRETKIEQTSVVYSPRAALRIVASINSREDAPES
jgi:DNA-binding GntR family transcriptional regulator